MGGFPRGGSSPLRRIRETPVSRGFAFGLVPRRRARSPQPASHSGRYSPSPLGTCAPVAGARTRSVTPGRRRSEHGRARPTSPDRPRPRIGDRPSGRADVLRRTGGWPCEDAPADPNERHCHGRNEAVGGRRVRRGAGRDGDRVSGPGNRSGSSLWRIGIRDPPDPNSHTRCVSQTRSTSPARVLTAGRQRARPPEGRSDRAAPADGGDGGSAGRCR